jgi:FkbM family methyltransferase
MIENFAQYIPDKSYNYIIFDIGSRDCEQSIEFYKMFPNAKIYAFECNPNTLKLCKNNIQNYTDRITLIEGAVCDYDGSITFYPINQEKTLTSWKDGNPGASSLFKSNGKYNIEKYVQDEITTNCHRLDSVMEKYNIPRVDIIWMDLQGAELLALKGLGKHLANLKYMHTEVSYQEMYTGQVMYKELNDFILSNGFEILNNLNPSRNVWQEDVIYKKKADITKKDFDIVIPVGPNDSKVLNMQIEFTKKNIIGYRNIYLISYDPSIIIDGCITIDEKIFPFTKNTVEKIHGKLDRNGWYLQQILKLYAGIVIDGILERYLVIDSDTLFLKPTTFIENDKCLYNYGREFHLPYFIHMKKLNKDFTKIYADKSGICHHMMFETKYVKEIIKLIETEHNDLFYNVFLNKVTDLNGSGASEYEIYFNYMIKYHNDKIIIRPLKWKNTNNLKNFFDFDYVSYHWYMR